MSQKFVSESEVSQCPSPLPPHPDGDCHSHRILSQGTGLALVPTGRCYQWREVDNTGGGGGSGGAGAGNTSGAGGSGVVILKYPSALTISNPGGGLTYTTSTSGSYKITTFTAGTGNVSWA